MDLVAPPIESGVAPAADSQPPPPSGIASSSTDELAVAAASIEDSESTHVDTTEDGTEDARQNDGELGEEGLPDSIIEATEALEIIDEVAAEPKQLEQISPSAAPKVGRGLAKASECDLSGAGLRQAVIWRETRFMITTAEAEGGDAVSILITSTSQGTRIRARVRDLGDGRYDVCYKPSVSGRLMITVTLNGEQPPGSPVMCMVTDGLPMAQQCVLSGEGLTETVARRQQHFFVEFRDATGESTHASELDVYVRRKQVSEDSDRADEEVVQFAPVDLDSMVVGPRPLQVRSAMELDSERVGVQLMPGTRLQVFKVEVLPDEGAQCACVLLDPNQDRSIDSWRELYAQLPSFRLKTWRQLEREKASTMVRQEAIQELEALEQEKAERIAAEEAEQKRLEEEAAAREQAERAKEEARLREEARQAAKAARQKSKQDAAQKKREEEKGGRGKGKGNNKAVKGGGKVAASSASPAGPGPNAQTKSTSGAQAAAESMPATGSAAAPSAASAASPAVAFAATPAAASSRLGVAAPAGAPAPSTAQVVDPVDSAAPAAAATAVTSTDAEDGPEKLKNKSPTKGKKRPAKRKARKANAVGPRHATATLEAPLSLPAPAATPKPAYGWVTIECNGAVFVTKPPEQLNAHDRQKHLKQWKRRFALNSEREQERAILREQELVDAQARAIGPLSVPKAQIRGKLTKLKGEASLALSRNIFVQELAMDPERIGFAFGGVYPGRLHAKGQIVERHKVSYSVGQAGQYELHVQLRRDSLPLPGSPFSLEVAPGLPHAFATRMPSPLVGIFELASAADSDAAETGSKSSQAGTARCVCRVTLIGIDKMGNRCMSGDDVDVECGITDSDSNVEAFCTDQGDGSFLLEWCSPTSGTHEVFVKIDGLHIIGSPATLRLTSGTPDLSRTEIISFPNRGEAGSKMSVRIKCKDVCGNPALPGREVRFGLSLIPTSDKDKNAWLKAPPGRHDSDCGR